MTPKSNRVPVDGGFGEGGEPLDPAPADVNPGPRYGKPATRKTGGGSRPLHAAEGSASIGRELTASRPAVSRLPALDELGLAGGRAEPASGRPLGPCPVCGRPMIEGASVDRHHLVPRSRGGRETVFLHRICHRKLHALWSEVELARLFHDVETIRAHPEIRRFVAWLRNKPATFWAPTRRARRSPSL